MPTKSDGLLVQPARLHGLHQRPILKIKSVGKSGEPEPRIELWKPYDYTA
jgi:hypothetical protein